MEAEIASYWVGFGLSAEARDEEARTDWDSATISLLSRTCAERETHGWYSVKRLRTDICDHPLSRILGAM